MDLLTDLQVVDCSSGIPGGYCAKLLGDAGADVIKVESPEGDPAAPLDQPGLLVGAPIADDGALFQFLHFGHRSIVATIAVRARSRRRLAALLAGADILITDAAGRSPPTRPRCTSGSRSWSSSPSRPTACTVRTPTARPPRSPSRPRAARWRCAATRAGSRCRRAGARWSG